MIASLDTSMTAGYQSDDNRGRLTHVMAVTSVKPFVKCSGGALELNRGFGLAYKGDT